METGNISSGASSFDSFKSNKAVSGTKEFLESNTAFINCLAAIHKDNNAKIIYKYIGEEK